MKVESVVDIVPARAQASEPAPVATRVPLGISPSASFNYSLAKVAAIFTVVLGHWFPDTVLWIPATVGLFLFAFSSGFFTLKIYGTSIDRPAFWRKKLERLGLRFWVILAILSVIVTMQGATVLHWHTVLHFAGLTGVLSWIPVPNQSGLGSGGWFFTLLLIFYISYPYLALMSRSRRGAALVALATVAAAIYLDGQVAIGHKLWLTAAGFILGVTYAAHEPRIRPSLCAATVILSCLALFALNVLVHDKKFNTVLIALASVALALWLSRAELPRTAVTVLIARLEKYLLEIFLMHTYLFVHVTGNSAGDLAVSLILVVLVAVPVHRLAEILSRQLLTRRAAQSSPPSRPVPATGK